MGFSVITVSFTKLVRIVTAFEAILPGLAIVLTAVLQTSQSYSVASMYFENYDAIDAVRYILSFSIFYLHLSIRMGLTILLWKGVTQRNLSRLFLWCISCVALVLTGLIICTVMLRYSLTLGQVTTILITLLTIASTFSLITVLILIQKIRSGSIKDYDDYMCLKFEKRDDLGDRKWEANKC